MQCILIIFDPHSSTSSSQIHPTSPYPQLPKPSVSNLWCPHTPGYGAIHWGVVGLGATPLEKTGTPFLRNLQLFIVFQLGMGARESLPTPGLNTGWLVLMQLLCRHLCEFINAVVRSCTKDTLVLWSSPISDSSNLSVSSAMTVPEPCGGEGYRCSICARLLHWQLFSTLWPAVSACTSRHTVHKEPSPNDV